MQFEHIGHSDSSAVMAFSGNPPVTSLFVGNHGNIVFVIDYTQKHKHSRTHKHTIAAHTSSCRQNRHKLTTRNRIQQKKKKKNK